MKCKICESETYQLGHAKILNQYTVTYFQCGTCQFVQTEEPYWLAEAYSQAIAKSDDGLVFRNLMLSQLTNHIITQFFHPDAHFLDYGGGYGLLVRLMRDARFKFDWYDQYCENLFAQEFAADLQTPRHYELVTAFELFEHFVNPLIDIQQLLQFSQTILFSTELLPQHCPKPGEWWYYAPQEGQHISFYTLKSLSMLAYQLGLNLYSNGTSLHLLTPKILSPDLFQKISSYNAEDLRRFLRRSRSYLKTLELLEPHRDSFPSPENFSSLPTQEGVKSVTGQGTESPRFPLPKMPDKPMAQSDHLPQSPGPKNALFVNNKPGGIAASTTPQKIAHHPPAKPNRSMDYQLGVNIAGFVNGEFGIGEGVRATIRSIETAGIPFVVNNFTRSPHRKLDHSYQQSFTSEHPYPINIIQLNANEVKVFLKEVGDSYFAHRYNIGFWAWELPIFPPEWHWAFSRFHEIWTYSSYCADSISMVSPIPVIKMMPSLSLETPTMDREALGLPPDKFIFLFMFDFYSRMERKNPMATIAAFKQAFGTSHPDVVLVIKCSNSSRFPEDRAILMQLIENCPSIQLIDGYLSREEINGLVYHCNCYVSLHRSEGFGLTMAEAMFYGKPVIATAYSSNTEFMNVGNSFLVKYDLLEITEDFGPYKKGNIWADADPHHAALMMQYVFSHYEAAQQVGARAAKEVRALLSPQAVGNRMKGRLEYIANLTHQFTGLPLSYLHQISTDEGSLASVGSEGQGRHDPEPLVSLCIPTYNGEAFIAEALHSALSQTYSHLEIIVSDDGSTDQTIAIAQGIQRENSRADIRIILHRNYGLCGNWNFCLEAAQGKYIKFLFQDDLLEPNCIEELVKLAEQDPEIGLVFSPRKVVLANGAASDPQCLAAYRGTQDLHTYWSSLKPIQSGQDLLRDPHWLKSRINMIGEPTTVLIRKSVFQHLGLFDSHLHQLLDVDMWFRIMGHYKIGFVDQSLSQLRIHPNQQTQKNISAKENFKDYQRLYAKMLEDATYDFLTEDLKERVREKQGKSSKPQPAPPPEVELSTTATWVAQYHQSPGNVSVLVHLRKMRQWVAEAWLKLTAEQLNDAYQGELGQAYQVLLKSGIKHEPFTDTEQIFVNDLIAHVAKGFEDAQAMQFFLAASLYQPIYQLPLSYQQARIPRWFFSDFIQQLFEVPLYFQDLGNVQQYAEFFPPLLSHIHGSIVNYPTAILWQQLAAYFAVHASLIPLSVRDINLSSLALQCAAIREYGLQTQGCQLDYEFSQKDPHQSKIRLGILLHQLGENRSTFAAIPIVASLGIDKFEIFLYYRHIENSNLGSYCQNRGIHLVPLPESLETQVQTIRHQDLDLLVIAADQPPQSPLIAPLALHRLARIQLTTAAMTPFSTGSRQIDYYIVGNFMVPPETAVQQYREQVILLDGSGLCFHYPVPAEATVVPTRSSWGANETSIVLMSAANAFKITPELRETWAKILAAVPNSLLVLYPFRSQDQDYPLFPFFHRIRSVFAHYGIDKKRLAIIKPLPSRTDLQSCLKLANLYLDAFPYTGASSLIEALLAGIPPIVWEGQNAHAKQGAALLRELQMPELITNSEAAYIELSITLATHEELRHSYQQKLQQKMLQTPHFLQTHRYSSQMAALFETLLQSKISG